MQKGLEVEIKHELEAGRRETAQDGVCLLRKAVQYLSRAKELSSDGMRT